MRDVFDDLEAEQDRLERVLLGLAADAWLSPSGAPGWSVADVVLHLAQTEEAVVVSAGGDADLPEWRTEAGTLDDAMPSAPHRSRSSSAGVRPGVPRSPRYGAPTPTEVCGGPPYR